MLKPTFTLLATIVAIALSPVAASAWSFETLDGNGGGNGRTTNSVSTDYTTVLYAGQPHTFYLDSSNGNLRHGWWNGAVWQFETLDGAGGANGRTFNYVGRDTSAVLYNGQPHVFYFDSTASDLRHGWWDGAAWYFETLDGSGGLRGQVISSVGEHTAATLYHGLPHAFYYDSGPGTLRHAWWNGAQWMFEVLDGEGGLNGRTNHGTGYQNSVVSYLGQPHVFSVDTLTEDLRHGWWNGAAWQFEVLDGAGGSAGQVSTATGFDSFAMLYQGRPHIFYQHLSTASDLRHAWWTGTQWQFETLDGAGGANGRTTHQVGFGSSGVLFNGEPHIFYQDWTENEVRHAWWNGATWSFEVLDGEGGANGRTNNSVGTDSTALLYGGRPHVFYGDISANDLRHAWH